MTKIKDIRSKSDAELITFVTETRAAIAGAHVDLKTKEVKHVKAIRNHKRDIARALTIQSEREMKSLEEQETSNE